MWVEGGGRKEERRETNECDSSGQRISDRKWKMVADDEGASPALDIATL